MMRWGGYEPNPRYIYFAGIILGLLIIGIFVSLAVRGEDFSRDYLYFISQEDNFLYVFSDKKVQTYSLNGFVEQNLYQELTKKCVWKKVGEGFGIAGGVVLTGGNIAALAIPPLSPAIKLATWITSGVLTGIGSILRFTSKDLAPQPVSCQLMILDHDGNIELNSEFVVLVSGWHYGLINFSPKTINGYLLMYSSKDPVGKIPLIETKKKRIEIIINPLGLYLRSLNLQHPPITVLRLKER